MGIKTGAKGESTKALTAQYGQSLKEMTRSGREFAMRCGVIHTRNGDVQGSCKAGDEHQPQTQRVPTTSITKKETAMENKDIRITLTYNVDEVNHLLSLLGTLPFSQSAPMIHNIQTQATPQLPISSENQDGGEVDPESNTEAREPA